MGGFGATASRVATTPLWTTVTLPGRSEYRCSRNVLELVPTAMTSLASANWALLKSVLAWAAPGFRWKSGPSRLSDASVRGKCSVTITGPRARRAIIVRSATTS